MKSIYEAPMSLRLIYAIGENSLGSLTRPKEVLQFAKQWLRFPIEYSATKLVNGTPAVGFADLFPNYMIPEVLPQIGKLDRHSWNVRLDEKIYISLIVKALNAQRIFEIGTFDGGTTLCMAESAGPEAEIFTLDLPPQEFDNTQNPNEFSGTQVGVKFHNTAAAQKITQLLGDSTKFDYSPYLQSMDLVFVDAAHDFIHGFPDSKNALSLVRPGGIVIWHDYAPYWHGLVHAIQAATQNYKLLRLSGTSLAMVQIELK